MSEVHPIAAVFWACSRRGKCGHIRTFVGIAANGNFEPTSPIFGSAANVCFCFSGHKRDKIQKDIGNGLRPNEILGFSIPVGSSAKTTAFDPHMRNVCNPKMRRWFDGDSGVTSANRR